MGKMKKAKKYIKDRFKKFLSIFNNDKQNYSSIQTEDMVKDIKDKLSKE